MTLAELVEGQSQQRLATQHTRTSANRPGPVFPDAPVTRRDQRLLYLQRIRQIREAGEPTAQPGSDVQGTTVAVPWVPTQMHLRNRRHSIHASSRQERELVRLELPEDHDVAE